MNATLRARLKRIPGLRVVNARWKAWNHARRWTRLELGYQRAAAAWKIPPGTTAIRSTIAQRQSRSGFATTAKKKGDLRLVWIGANEAQDEAGLLRGLWHFGMVHVVRGLDGRYLPLEENDATRQANHETVIRQVDRLHRAQRVDAVLGQCWAQFLPVETFRQISRMGIA